MALTLSQAGIETSNTVEAWHITQSIDAFTGTEAYDITISGSLEITGSINAEGSSHELRSTGVTLITGSNISLNASSAVVVNGPFVEITDNTNPTILDIKGTLTDDSILEANIGTEVNLSQAGVGSTGYFRIPNGQTGNGSLKAGMMYWDDTTNLLYIYSETSTAWVSASFV